MQTFEYTPSEVAPCFCLGQLSVTVTTETRGYYQASEKVLCNIEDDYYRSNECVPAIIIIKSLDLREKVFNNGVSFTPLVNTTIEKTKP